MFHCTFRELFITVNAVRQNDTSYLDKPNDKIYSRQYVAQSIFSCLGKRFTIQPHHNTRALSTYICDCSMSI